MRAKKEVRIEYAEAEPYIKEQFGIPIVDDIAVQWRGGKDDPHALYDKARDWLCKRNALGRVSKDIGVVEFWGICDKACAAVIGCEVKDVLTVMLQPSAQHEAVFDVTYLANAEGCDCEAD